MFYLKQIDLIGFKSFANKTTLQFPSGATSIVGPNGSGKSNIVDAVSWVLGEQRIKQLRGKKSEDIIFAGSEGKPRMGFCEVSLTFHNDGTIPDCLSEVTVTRRLERNQESAYEINKKKATLQDILLLLSRAHVGAKQIQIIGQGMIDQILLATPQKRKELFDEGSGLQEFYIRRQKSYTNLKKTLHVLDEVHTQRNILAPELSHAKSLAQKLQKRQAAETKLKELQQSFYYFSWKEIHEQFEKTFTAQKQEQKAFLTMQQEIETLKKNTLTLSKPDTSAVSGLQNQFQLLSQQKQLIQKQIWALTQQMQRPPETKKNQLTTAQIIASLKELKKAQETFIKEAKHQEVDTKDIFSQLEIWMKQMHHLITELENTPQEKPISSELMEKLEQLQKQSAQLDDKMQSVTESIVQAQQKQHAAFAAYTHQQKELNAKQQHFLELSTKAHQLDTQLVLIRDQKNRLEQEIQTEVGQIPHAPSKEYPQKPRDVQIQALKQELLSLGLIDPGVLEKYQKLQAQMDDLTKQTEDLTTAMHSLTTILKQIDEEMKQLFFRHFEIINTAFATYFTRLFGGGKAKLVLIESSDTETSDEETHPLLQQWRYSSLEKQIAGIDIEACPPKKKVQHLSLLSGGERSLTALALICAFLEAHPVPFVILDEVDAALDEANSAKLADIFKELSTKTQLILITHNRATMSGADVLYGITMQQAGISRLVSLKLDQALQQINKYRG